MAFYSPDAAMGQHLEALVRALELDGRPGLSSQLSVTWLRYGPGRSGIDAGANLDTAAFWRLQPQGSSWNGERCRPAASMVQLVYLVAAEAWLQADRIHASEDLTAALAAMMRASSNDATSLVVDLLSGTTSGPRLVPEAMVLWQRQRQLVNQWLQGLGWPELAGWNACQKTWTDAPHGRDRVACGSHGENHNRLSSDGVARLLHALIGSAIVSPPACARMRRLLARNLDGTAPAADPGNPVAGFLGEALAEGARLWGKASWMREARHDAAYLELPSREGLQAHLLVVCSEGEACAADAQLLPELARRLLCSPYAGR